MAVTIFNSKLRLMISDGEALPDVFIKNQVGPGGFIICHLTHGFQSSTFPLGQQDAVTANAHLPLSGPPGSTSFGFVQIGCCRRCAVHYAGRTSSEGHIAIVPDVPPALPDPVMLDATGNPQDPWFKDPSVSFVPPEIHASWGDHPASQMPLKRKNPARSNVYNYLFWYIDEREFWTILTAQDPVGAPRYVAHFHWLVLYDVQLTWRSEMAQLRRSKSLFKMIDRKVKGRPMEPDLQSKLTNPVGPRANDLFKKAIDQAFYGPRGRNRQENEYWPHIVPADFWG